MKKTQSILVKTLATFLACFLAGIEAPFPVQGQKGVDIVYIFYDVISISFIFVDSEVLVEPYLPPDTLFSLKVLTAAI